MVPATIDAELAEKLVEVEVQHPKRGKKKELVELACKNAKIALGEKFYLIERDEERTVGAVERLGEELGIAAPYRIEAFDNSNIQGTDPVSAMIVLLMGNRKRKNIANIKLRR